MCHKTNYYRHRLAQSVGCLSRTTCSGRRKQKHARWTDGRPMADLTINYQSDIHIWSGWQIPYRGWTGFPSFPSFPGFPGFPISRVVPTMKLAELPSQSSCASQASQSSRASQATRASRAYMISQVLPAAIKRTRVHVNLLRACVIDNCGK